MTKKHTHPSFPATIPQRCGRRAVEQYKKLRQLLLKIDDPEGVLVASVQLAQFIEGEPNASETTINRLWDAIYDWNFSRLNPAQADEAARAIRCSRCAESRVSHMEAALILTKHADVVRFKEIDLSAVSVLSARGINQDQLPTVLRSILPVEMVVNPQGCEHSELVLTCRTCQARIPGSFIATLDAPNAPVPNNEEKNTLN